jgi:hypothetical protein
MTRPVLPSASAWTLLAGCLLAPPAGRSDEPAVNFDRDVRPILSNNCFKCHGPDAKQRRAGLRLDHADAARATLKSGNRAVVPGDRAASALVARVTAAEPTERMPPPDTGKTLSPEQVAVLKRWIDEGAEFRDHWSFVPVRRPAPPRTEGTGAAGTVQNPIDRFVLARLKRENLQPSPPADRTTLIRRVTYDLTGLPPAPAEVDAFLADGRPDAYERLVERLLASPRYGEHMARYWLDAVRYADTHGLHFDNERSLWPYRDWVVRAFNRNVPFDQFTVEQVAGDLLPQPTREQRIASGFNRCNVTSNEGGSIDEEMLMRYAVDRTEAVSTVFLGLTLGCAVCHDHKFDPVTQKEFYQLYAFFNSAADKAMDDNIAAPPPILKLTTPEQEARLKSFDAQVAAARRDIAERLARIDYADPAAETSASLADQRSSAAAEPAEFVWIEDDLPSGARPEGDSPWRFVTREEGPVFSGARASTRTAKGLSQHFFTGAEPGLKLGAGDRLFAYVYLDAANPPQTIMLQFNDGTWEHRAFWGTDHIPFGPAGTPAHVAMGALPEPGRWVRLEVDAAQVGLKADSVLNGWAFTQFGGTVYWDKAGVVTRTPQGGTGVESLAGWVEAERSRKSKKLPRPVQAALQAEADKRTAEQDKILRDHFLENVYPVTRPLFEGPHQVLESLTKAREAYDATINRSMVMADMPNRREAFVHVRGAYDKKGEKVAPGTPSVLPSLPADAPPNRLGLARWLVAPEHPLTARVTVNRFWQQYFGRGIVKTANDFGYQGEWPTDPELLDWLAAEFVESGWDVKHLQRLIVTSGTYRQASKVSPELLRRDPENALLARGPRFRMDAEMVRDTMLAASGLLAERQGGRAVKPYQPPGLWEAVGFLGSDTRDYRPDSGAALYRRSLYTFWKRTSPPAALATFDAPSRETCTVRRARTNTPLQALALMNDEQYVEAARHLARRMMTEAGPCARDRLAYGFRLATARRPDAAELDELAKLFAQELAHYWSDKDGATKLVGVGASPRDPALEPGEHAAWTIVANLILNLDETVTKE